MYIVVFSILIVAVVVRQFLIDGGSVWVRGQYYRLRNWYRASKEYKYFSR